MFNGKRHFFHKFLLSLFYFAVAIGITYPLISDMSTHLFGDFLTDSYQTARHVWWIGHALENGESIFQQSTLGYPEGLQGAWLWANPLEYFPAWVFALVMPLNTAVNLMLLLQMTLNGLSAYVLINHLTGKRFYPALLAGVIFMSFPALQGRIYGGHVGVLALWGVPLLLYILFRLREEPSFRLYAFAGFSFVLGIAGNSTLLVYYLMPTVGILLLMQIATKQWTWFRRSMIACFIGGVLSLGLLLPLLIETVNTPQYNLSVSETVRFSADLLAFASPSMDGHPLFGALDYPNQVLGLNLVEGIGYIGILVSILALIGVWKHKQARWWLIVGLVAWVFSLGPLLKINDTPVIVSIDNYQSTITLPWAWLQNLPILNISRTPGRFNLTIALVMAVMAGYGVQYIGSKLKNQRVRYAVLIGVGFAILFEMQMFWGMPHDEVLVPHGVHQLAERDDIRAVFNIPYNDRIFAKHGLYHQAIHGHNLIAGQFVRDTPVNPARLTVLQATLDPAILDYAGVDVVVFHRLSPDLSYPFEPILAERLGQDIYQDALVRIFDVPDVETDPEFTVVYPNETIITASHDLHLFAPEAGWARLQGRFNADGRELLIMRNNEMIHRVIATDETNLDLWIPIPEAGFHTVSLQLDPICPRNPISTLRCDSVSIDSLTVDSFTLHPPDNSVSFANGVSLERQQVFIIDSDVTVNLFWHFDEGISDYASRFIHIIDESGSSVIQVDNPLRLAPDESWAETQTLTLPDDLADGRYRVYTGWYRYDDLTRFAISSDVIGAGDGWVLLHEFIIGDQ